MILLMAVTQSAVVHYPKLSLEAEKATSTIIALNKDK